MRHRQGGGNVILQRKSAEGLSSQTRRVHDSVSWRDAKRDKLNGTNGFLQKSVVFCSFLPKSAVSCGPLRKSAPPKCCNSQEKRTSAKISENPRKTSNLARVSLLVCPFYFPLRIGTMWQIGVLTGKPCTFRSKMGHFRRFGTTKIRRDFRGINRASEWLWREAQETTQNTVSKLERQFATLYLFHAPTGVCVRQKDDPQQPRAKTGQTSDQLACVIRCIPTYQFPSLQILKMGAQSSDIAMGRGNRGFQDKSLKRTH